MSTAQTEPLYAQQITSQEEAVCHLFFHSCLRDGRFVDSELDAVAGRVVSAGLHKTLNIKDEIVKYRSYSASITDDAAYIRHLVQKIKPANELALYSYCMELCIEDAELSAGEEKLLETLASELHIPVAEQAATKKLIAQRKVVETQKLF